MPIIHTNVEVLKSKLSKYEPVRIARRIGVTSTVVIAIDKLEFDSSIPILKEKHLNRAPPPQKSSPRKPAGPKKRGRPKSNEGKRRDHVESETKRNREPDDELEEEFQRRDKRQVVRTANLVDESEEETVDVPGQEPVDIPEEQPANIPEDETADVPYERPADNLEERLEPNPEDDLQDEPGVDQDETESNVAFPSTIDCLVLTGPDVDEFRLYDDDDEEEETALSKNLKKIRTEALPQKPQRPQPPPPPPPRPMQQRHSQSSNSNIAAASSGLTQQPPAPPPPELTVGDIDKLVEQRNFRLVYAELNRRKETFKSDEAARLTLKKSISSCLERDDTFVLLDLLGLVFEFDYLSDTKFWDELIGKLKRKNNPHAKCLTFKCDVDPTLVLHNYKLIVRKIAEHFDSTNPTITLPWLTFRYLGESLANATSTSSHNQAVSGAPFGPTLSNGTAPPPRLGTAPAAGDSTAQENHDPTCERGFSWYKDIDGKQKFKIKIPKGEMKYSAADVKLLL